MEGDTAEGFDASKYFVSDSDCSKGSTTDAVKPWMQRTTTGWNASEPLVKSHQD